MAINPDDPYEKILVTALANMGHDITDRTAVHCDICYEKGEDSMGGVVMLDRDPRSAAMGSTFACTQCFKEFTCVKPKKRKPRPNTRQAAALRGGIGTDPEWYLELDAKRSFHDNVIEIRKNPEKYGGLGQPWVCEVDMKKSIERSLERAKGTKHKSSAKRWSPPKSVKVGDLSSKSISHGLLARPYATCTGCRESKPAADLKLCTRCRLARYCNKKCQRFDWNQGHKDNCK